jgi:hypothetical protein
MSIQSMAACCSELARRAHERTRLILPGRARLPLIDLICEHQTFPERNAHLHLSGTQRPVSSGDQRALTGRALAD